MKNLFVILFFLFSVLCYSQEDPIDPSRIKGEGYAIRDANNEIVIASDGGVLAIIYVEDTASSQLVLPPDTAQVFNVTLAASDTFSSLKTELRAYYSLEEVSGNAVDSANNYDLTPHGTIAYGQIGKIGDCFSFATNGFLDSTPNVFNLSSFTVAFWLNSTDTDPVSGLVTNFGVSNYGWETYILHSGTGKARFQLRYSGGNIQLSSTTTVNDGSWHHLAFSFEETDDSAKLYVNGVLEDYDVMPAPINYHSSCVFAIGSRLGAQYFLEGKMDEIVIHNRELTQTEIDSLAAENVFPFIGEGSGGDSLRMIIGEPDLRADTMRIIANPIGEGRSDSRTDGILLFAFNMDDFADYSDTTFLWDYLKDTTYIIEAYTGLIPENTWTEIPNYTTILVDSSDITPPDQDVGIWDTIYYNDFEQHSAPSYYDRTTFLSEWNPERSAGYDQYRASDYRVPVWFRDNLKDSIIIDETTGSKALQVLWAEGIHDGYDGQSNRGGDYWRHRIGGEPYTEIYVSSNVMVRPGFDFSKGGKLIWGIGGGTGPRTGGFRPGYGEGFMNAVVWHWDDRYGLEGVITWYNFHQDQPHSYGDQRPWGEFQPEGDGLTGRYNSYGYWEIPTDDSIWFNITVRCVVNTHTGSTPNHDGLYEGFINGHLVTQWGGLYMITYPDIGNEIWLLNWYQSFGGGGPPERDEWIWNDDVFIFTYDESVDVPRGNELSQPGRVLSLPNWPKQ